jgi:hypothetical protein
MRSVECHEPAPAGRGGRHRALTKGRLQIQTEGAEVFYRNIAVRRLSEFPEGYRP